MKKTTIKQIKKLAVLTPAFEPIQIDKRQIVNVNKGSARKAKKAYKALNKFEKAKFNKSK